MVSFYTSSLLLSVGVLLAFFAGCLNLFVAVHLTNGLRRVFTLISVMAFVRAGGYGWILFFEEHNLSIGTYESVWALVALSTVWTLPAVYTYKNLRRASVLANKIDITVQDNAE